MNYPFLSSREGKVRLAVILAPRASRARIMGVHGDRLKVAVTTAPVEGKANEALIEFLAKLFGRPKSAIKIEQGHTGRRKMLTIEGLRLEELAVLLDSVLNSD